MLERLRQVAREGGLHITGAYMGHIKNDEGKVLAHAEAGPWENIEPTVRSLLEQHLYQAIEGPEGEVNFTCHYTGEVLSVAKVAPGDYDRTRNRPAVEVLEAVRDLGQDEPDRLVELGNILSYKLMAAGAISNHLLGVLRFYIVPSLGAAPVPFTFATVCDLDDREESFFDDGQGRFVTQTLRNVIKRGHVSRAVLFPCLDEEGREKGDMLVYAGSGASSWFRALEASRRLSPRREGQALVRMISEQEAEVPHDLFRQMGSDLLNEAEAGMRAEAVVSSLERAVGHGLDRAGFLSRWESTFGDAGYRAAYGSLFGEQDLEKPTRLKMQAGEIAITLTPAQLEHFRQAAVGERTFILFAVPERAKVVVGKELDLRIRAVAPEEIVKWMQAPAGE